MLSSSLTSNYPTVINIVLLLMHCSLGAMIFAHGFYKVFRGGKLAGTAGWFESIGMRPGKINAFLAAATEWSVGVLLVVGFLTPLACAGLIALMLVAIVTVHRKNGFFVFYKGEGWEYNAMIAVMSLVLGTLGAGRYSIDHVTNIIGWNQNTNLMVTLCVGVGAALGQLLAVYRPPKQQ